MEELERILREHAKRYPLMQPTDAVKLIYQNEFGGGHLIRDEQACLNYLRREYAAVEKDPTAPLYTLTLSKTVQEIAVAANDGMTVKTYSIGYSEREASSAADKVVDYLMVNSQYINGNAGGYGTNPQQTLTGGLLSLGNFGGYVTFYVENGLTDDPNNAYGVDFYINGNAFKDVSTGTGLGSMEPGQVWVSEDGNTWYALAGSEHYEDSTLWDYAVTYTKTETGSTDWEDNQGNTMASTHGRSFAWPSPNVYTMNDLPKQSSFSLTSTA